MDTAVFDAQMIDLITGWLIHRRCGRSLYSAFMYASMYMADPYYSEWLKIDSAMQGASLDNPPRPILNGALQAMAERIPSGAAKQVADTFSEIEGYAIDEAVRQLWKTLWQQFGLRPLPPVTDFDEIMSLINHLDDNPHARSQLLQLEDRLLPFLCCLLRESEGRFPAVYFDMIKALGTPEAIRQLRTLVTFSHLKAPAQQTLHELGAEDDAT
jgi:hypothetical protein